MNDHTHECRDCGTEIEHTTPETECLWDGGNDGCTCDAGRVRAFESVCGPWFTGDRPEDIVYDIKSCDPFALVTVEDARAYLSVVSA